MMDTTNDGSVLVSPLGLSPGSLYSALCLTCPSRLVVITSEGAAGGVELALTAYQGDGHAPSGSSNSSDSVRVFKLMDPQKGFDEAAAVAAKIRTLLPGAGANTVVNVTGGSTVLQLASLYVGLPLPKARLVAVSDDRAREEQLAHPFRVGVITEVPRPVDVVPRVT